MRPNNFSGSGEVLRGTSLKRSLEMESKNVPYGGHAGGLRSHTPSNRNFQQRRRQDSQFTGQTVQ